MTLINVFTVKPENQEKLAILLVTVTEKVMKDMPGFMCEVVDSISAI